MINYINGSVVPRRLLFATTLLAVAFVLSHASNAPAQSPVTTNGGTISKIPKWTTSTLLGDSVITESAAGNIGIGTANPLYKLDIFGSTASQLHLTSNGTSSGLYLFANGGDAAYYLGGASFDGAQWIAKSPFASVFAEANGQFVFYNNSGLTPGNAFAPTERMRLDYAGNLGIGTATPTSMLDIVQTWDNPSISKITNASTGASSFAMVAANSDLATIDIRTHSTGRTVTRYGVTLGGYSELVAASGNGLLIGTFTNAKPIIFGTNGLERLRIESNGSVGIGTTAPAYKLDVNGEINATGLRINGTPISTSGPGAVASVFGRTGPVVAANNDYTWAQINKTTSSLADLFTRSAGDLSSGTLPAARMPALTGDVTTAAGNVATTLANTTVTPGSYTNASITVDSKGRITAASTGGGGGSTAFSDITAGTNTAALVVGAGGSLGVSGSGVINATTLGGATFAAPGAIGGATPGSGAFTTVSGSGANLTALNASNLASGTVAPARLGSGTANSSTFLRGDNTWAVPSGGGSSPWITSAPHIYFNTGNVGIGTDSPAFLLDVKGSANTPFRVRDSADREYFSTTTRGTGPVVSLAAGRLTVDNNGPEGGNDTILRRQVNSLVFNPSDHPDFPGGFMVRQVGGSAILWVEQNANGKVGIGTTSPGYKLDVQGGSINGSGGLCIAGDCKTAWSQVGGTGEPSQWTTSGSNIHYALGKVGVGTTTPQDTLDVRGNALIGTSVKMNIGLSATEYPSIGYNVGYTGDLNTYNYRATDSAALIRFGNGGRMSFHVAPSGTAGTLIGFSEAMVLTNVGNVGIGTTSPTTKLHVVGDGKVTGNLTVDGNIAAKYQDLAEWVLASEQIPAGAVVVLDSTKSNHVISSTRSYDTRVAGVISEKPGIALGESGDNKVLVATTGRVRIKVDATRGPIHIGDLLVTSDISGMAMKSEPVSIGGVQIHRPGTLIGKALEPLAKGQGEILVLLSLQ